MYTGTGKKLLKMSKFLGLENIKSSWGLKISLFETFIGRVDIEIVQWRKQISGYAYKYLLLLEEKLAMCTYWPSLLEGKLVSSWTYQKFLALPAICQIPLMSRNLPLTFSTQIKSKTITTLSLSLSCWGCYRKNCSRSTSHVSKYQQRVAIEAVQLENR